MARAQPWRLMFAIGCALVCAHLLACYPTNCPNCAPVDPTPPDPAPFPERALDGGRG